MADSPAEAHETAACDSKGLFTMPSRGAVDLWTLDLDLTAPQLAVMSSLLSPLECGRANRFHFDVHRNRYIAAHGWLRRILGGYLSVGPESLEFQSGLRGKPALAGSSARTGLEFNLAHSQNLGLLGVAQGMPVGVDLEEIRPLADAQELVARFFSRNESDLFEALPDERKASAFFSLWTRKEAWLKATGEGIAHLLAELEVSFLPGEPARVVRLPEQYQSTKAWSLFEIEPQPGFVGALAVPATQSTIQMRSGRQLSSLLP